uniref:C2H2-type domain-containing protein n=1 Tax=Sander lucioperca TaxID=283035 RepID=A0A8C9ZB78_SANLU
MKCPFNCKRCNRGFWNKSLLRNHNRKCRFGRISERSTTQQLEVPLKAQIDFVLNDSVLVFKDASTSAGTGVLQTNFSHKDDLMAESPQNSEENQVQSSPSKEKKAVQYQCSECDKSFTDGLMLISHLEDHGRQEQAKKRNSCIKCGQVFASQGNLERHMKLHENNRKYSCPDCSKVVYTQSELEIHRTCHDLNRPFACKLCNYRFWTRPSLCNHYREEHPDDTFTCRFCNKAYSVKKSLARHYRRWHKKEQRDLGRTVPDKCSTEQQSSSQVSTTGESGEDEKNGSEDSDSDSAPYFPCHVCGKTFPTSESLEDHQRCHLGEKPHECAECGRCFFQASQLQQHQRMHKSEFQCQACGRGFVSLFALRKHKHTHGKSRPYRCSKCDFSFTGPSQLAEHMSTHREENFPCDICNLVFPSKSSRAEHRKSHSKSGDHPPPSIPREEHEKSASHTESSSVSPKELKYRCGVCGERFRDPEELSEHGCMAAKERPYSCSDCDKHFLHASHLKKHRTTHQLSSSTSEYPSEIKHKGKDEGLAHGFICPVCHQCFASATELMCHFPTHPDGIFECKICKMTFPSESKLEEHNRSHVISATEFECTDCGQSFWGKDAEYSSPSAKTSPPTYYQAVGEEEIDVTGEDLYNCPVCSMQFYSKSGLLEHQNKQHQNEKPFECQLCGKTFARKRYLREHERRHRQKETAQLESKFKCTQCVTEFSSAQDLSLHMRLHAEKEVGEYRCEMCYKSFSQWSHLKQHQESHVGQVVYECTECDKAFAFPHLLEEHQQTHFIIHQRVHTGERPFKCPECGRGFSKNSNLNLHLKTHKKSNIYKKCPFCKIKFSCSEYASHMKIHAHLLDQDSEDSKSEKHSRGNDHENSQDLRRPVSPVKRERKVCQYCGKTFPPSITQSVPTSAPSSESSHMKESAATIVSSLTAAMPIKSSPSIVSEMEQHRQPKPVTWSSTPTSTVLASTSSLRHDFSIPSSYIDGAALWSVRPALQANSQISPNKLAGASTSAQIDQSSAMPISTPVSHGVGSTLWDMQTPPGIPKTLNAEKLVNTQDFQLQQKQVSSAWANVQSQTMTQKVPISIQYEPHRFGQALGTPVWGFQSNQTLLTGQLKPGNGQELQQQPMVSGTQIIINQPSPFFSPPLAPLPPLALPGPHPLHSVAVGTLSRHPHPNLFFTPQAVMSERPHIPQTMPLPQLAPRTEPHKLGPRLPFAPERLLQCMICGCSLPRELDLQMHYLQHAQGEI